MATTYAVGFSVSDTALARELKVLIQKAGFSLLEQCPVPDSTVLFCILTDAPPEKSSVQSLHHIFPGNDLPLVALIPTAASPDPWLLSGFDAALRTPPSPLELASLLRQLFRTQIATKDSPPSCPRFPQPGMCTQIDGTSRWTCAIADFAPDWAMWTHDIGQPIYISPSCEKITGYPPESFEKNPGLLLELIHPEDRAKFLSDGGCQGEGHQTPCTVRLLHRDGNLRWISHTCAPILTPDGSMWGIRSSNADVSELMETREALRLKTAEFQAIFDDGPMGVAILSLENSRILTANRILSLMLDYSQEELREFTIADLTLPEDYLAEKVLAEQATKSGSETFHLRKRVIPRNGHPIWVNLTNSIVHDSTGTPLFGIQILENVSERHREEGERRKLERALFEQQKTESIALLAGGLAHDFNNLLMAISGNTELIRMALPSCSPEQAYITQIEQAVQGAARLSNQMLAYAGQGKYHLESMDLSSLVQGMADILESSVGRRITLLYDLADSLPPIMGDPLQIRQLLTNLVINSGEAIGGGHGLIRVSTGLSLLPPNARFTPSLSPDGTDEWVILRVSDSGCGMDESTLERIFDPFFSTKFTGRGLGLPAVQGIVRGHGAALLVESRKGDGTDFTIYFRPSFEAESAGHEPVASLTEARIPPEGVILVVDDEEMVRTAASRLLERAGYQVVTAEDGPYALDMLKRWDPPVRCVILDLTMPQMDGVEAFQRIQELHPDLPVILSSGYSREEVAHRFSQTPPAAFLHKPYRIEELLRTVSSVCLEA